MVCVLDLGTFVGQVYKGGRDSLESMSFEITAKDGSARVGRLKTAHGWIETPFFMPVATRGTGKYLTPNDYKEIESPAIICNSYLLSCRPGIEIIEKAGGIHGFMNYSGVITTDCGGFQVSRKFHQQTTRRGIHFKDPFFCKNDFITPGHIMEIQNTIGADIVMGLDDMPLYGASLEEVQKSMENTHRWMAESKKAHKREGQLLFGICQGGFFQETREESAKVINSMGFDGNAIGGIAIGEPREDMYHAIKWALPHLDEDKPRYLMGVGSPVDVVECVSRGIDFFDSVYPTQSGRHNTLYTSKGKLYIDGAVYRDDLGPIDSSCGCHACKNYSRAYIHHLIKIKEPMAKRLKSIHNLFFMRELMDGIRKAIREGRLSAFKKEIVKRFGDGKGRLK
ncbi:tRNA guanosine(34) transglycosylase Tgt [Candidatus Woesearchaeota archaeon]|nr:tRNA guanosine(34) transglycosylase Tgt [Candidatus Woesearchaeota archaeon]